VKLQKQITFNSIIASLVVSDVDRVERFGLTLRFFDDASENSVCSFYVVFYFLLKVHVNFSSVCYKGP